MIQGLQCPYLWNDLERRGVGAERITSRKIGRDKVPNFPEKHLQ